MTNIRLEISRIQDFNLMTKGEACATVSISCSFASLCHAPYSIFITEKTSHQEHSAKAPDFYSALRSNSLKDLQRLSIRGTKKTKPPEQNMFSYTEIKIRLKPWLFHRRLTFPRISTFSGCMAGPAHFWHLQKVGNSRQQSWCA